MKRLILSICAVMLIAFSAHADKRIGVLCSFDTTFDSSGTETTKSSGEKNSATEEEDVIVPSLFVEFANDRGIALGFDIVPVDNQELGSGTGSDDDAETSGANTASAELTGHYTLYGLAPLGSGGAYFKFGLARATIDTTENLSTGTTYGNEDVDGVLVGIGLNRVGLTVEHFLEWKVLTQIMMTLTLKVHLMVTQLVTAVRNEIDADIDALAFRISVGRSF